MAFADLTKDELEAMTKDELNEALHAETMALVKKIRGVLDKQSSGMVVASACFNVAIQALAAAATAQGSPFTIEMAHAFLDSLINSNPHDAMDKQISHIVMAQNAMREGKGEAKH